MSETAEVKMDNPYIKAGQDFVSGVLSGGSSQLPAPGAADRLRQFAYYMTEQQKNAGDALLVSDLWDAVKVMERVQKRERTDVL